MFSEGRLFQIALAISIITHGVVFLQYSNLSLWPDPKKNEEKLEVSYIKDEKKPVLRQAFKESPPKKKMEPFLDLAAKLNAQKRTPPPFVERGDPLARSTPERMRQFEFSRPALMKPDVIAVKKRVSLPPIDMNKINNPSYISYYQILREKIRRSAYQNYQPRETGEVYLSFVVLGDGSLKETRLSEADSSSSEYLRGIALRSVKEASPFPHFPKELDYPQLSFNVVISFEIE